MVGFRVNGLLEEELDAAIECATRVGVVDGARSCVAESPRGELVCRNARPDEIGHHRFGTPLAEHTVVVAVAGRVGVAVDEDGEVGMGGEQRCDSVEHYLALSEDRRAAVGEENVTRNGQLLEVMRQRVTLEVGKGDGEAARPQEVEPGGDGPHDHHDDEDRHHRASRPVRGSGRYMSVRSRWCHDNKDAASVDEVARVIGDDATIMLEPADIVELDHILAGDPTGSSAPGKTIRRVFATSTRLAVYGTLAPGRPNYSVIASLHGDWHPGFVCGTYYASGRAAAAGYPGIVIDPTAAPVAVDLLVADGLTSAWSDIDAFEGPGYSRRLTTVRDEAGRLIAVANIYELAPDAVPDDPDRLVRSNR
jgi:gamma-glutamylcyclotransferase (GGCT)/AIG2-like uncharacterized protein YtfP